MEIASFVNEGLGHSSYVVDLGDGTALVVDPARIPSAQLAFATDHGLVAYTADTHTHADDVSGSPVLASRGALPGAPLPAGPVATMCGTTERAMTGASVLQRAGHADVALLRGGFSGWSSIAGHDTAVDT